jgi:aspartate carbamoyltransferase catalytic subunit
VAKSFESIVCGKASGKVRVQHDLDDVLSGARIDAIMMLRVQFERMEKRALNPPGNRR